MPLAVLENLLSATLYQILDMPYYYLVQNGEISGQCDSDDIQLPGETWSIVSSDENIPITEAVLEDGVVVRRPFISEPVYMTPVSAALNWSYLESELRNSSAWAKAYAQAEKSVKANTAFTLILTTVSITHNLDDLRFGWDRLRTTMQSQSSLEDFDAVELHFVRETLEECGFDPTGFNLAEAE